ncbi:MAG: hydrogenase expression/formation protein HypE [Candidatus Hydrothermarchaeota archaeon]
MKITLAHGSGGELTNRLIERVIMKKIKLKEFKEGIGIPALDDGASIPFDEFDIVLTTDSHTVKPIFFPGGDIGKLSVCGTINDLAVMGAKPMAILSSFVIEEGFEVSDLEKILSSMDSVSKALNVPIIGGDTKVMGKGELDEIIITTTGIGIANKKSLTLDSNVRIGDKIILSGTIGDHGIAILTSREGFEVEGEIKSDLNEIWTMVEGVIDKVNAMKDPTRGGLSAALIDFASKSNVGIEIFEDRIPIKKEVKSICEMLGLNPYDLTNEGKVVIAVSPENADSVLEHLRSTYQGKEAQIIGEATDTYAGKVILNTVVGGKRFLERPIGDPIPRIC